MPMVSNWVENPGSMVYPRKYLNLDVIINAGNGELIQSYSTPIVNLDRT